MTKCGQRGNMCKLSARAREKPQIEKKFEKRRKKFLTNELRCGKMLWPPRGDSKQLNRIGSKKFEKTWKKFLTNETECDKISELRRWAASEPVPCKLNNVKTNYNPLDNYELFKISCKRILSQRKFLSNIARSKLFKKWFEQPRGCLDTIFWEFDPGSGRTLAACLTHASRTG